MNNIYFFANQVYQYGHAKPIYDKVGGTFIVNKLNRALRFKYYLANTEERGKGGLFRTPKLKIKPKNEVYDLNGIIISGSNTEIKHDKAKSKSIFIGHGAGDKKFGGSGNTLETYDYHFVSGPKHVHKQKDMDIHIPEDKLIKIGYPKFDDYVNDKIDKDKYLDYLGIKNQNRKNILYAPTWRWGDGTLKKYGKKFIKELDKNFNLIIRPHFHDREYIKLLKLWAKYNGYKNVYFSNPAKIIKNNTMNDFAISDLMISDTSSIIYEYLITKKPIIIANNDYDQLHSMPDEMSVLSIAKNYDGEKSAICDMVSEDLNNPNLVKVYNKMLNNCFYFNDGKSTQRAIDFINKIQQK
jgi:CDP-glycerol glycerophosphotransferase (TagB/SpsB family)